ncbi:DNA-directed RNA polymerase subunit beta [Cohnella thermotolerans]|uniref:DNA-directed RNA polymerase subunit beta n=1 Tax=Cohnella thermotolerans TaxID=329858 RepID=UPI001F0ABFF8|nr:DNA-directed RNA polymerase subunit beta [Cohnella thermotolerans]
MAASNRPPVRKKRSAGHLLWQIIWTTIKVLIIPVLCIVALVAGLAIGYVVLGKGQLADVFDLNTWRHMYDLVFAESG